MKHFTNGAIAEDMMDIEQKTNTGDVEAQYDQGSRERLEGMLCQLARENQQLRQHLAQARAAMLHKDEVIMEWIAAATAWKAVSTALREEGQGASDRAQHPLAHDPAQRNRIYRETRRSAHARLKAQLFPPTSWRPR